MQYLIRNINSKNYLDCKLLQKKRIFKIFVIKKMFIIILLKLNVMKKNFRSNYARTGGI